MALGERTWRAPSPEASPQGETRLPLLTEDVAVSTKKTVAVVRVQSRRPASSGGRCRTWDRRRARSGRLLLLGRPRREEGQHPIGAGALKGGEALHHRLKA
jgi:hypothetical protein